MKFGHIFIPYPYVNPKTRTGEVEYRYILLATGTHIPDYNDEVWRRYFFYVWLSIELRRIFEGYFWLRKTGLPKINALSAFFKFERHFQARHKVLLHTR